MNGPVVILEGAEYELIPYGRETVGGALAYSTPCHVCFTFPNAPHRRHCPMGPGLHRLPNECLGCGVSVGALHVMGCGIEQCPCCGGQYMSCRCERSQDGPDEEEGT